MKVHGVDVRDHRVLNHRNLSKSDFELGDLLEMLRWGRREASKSLHWGVSCTHLHWLKSELVMFQPLLIVESRAVGTL